MDQAVLRQVARYQAGGTGNDRRTHGQEGLFRQQDGDEWYAYSQGVRRALGLADKIGSIRTGKAADMCAVCLDTLETRPCYDPASHLVYAAGREHVSHVWVNGVLRVENGLLQGCDTSQLLDTVNLWQNKLTA